MCDETYHLLMIALTICCGPDGLREDCAADARLFGQTVCTKTAPEESQIVLRRSRFQTQRQ